MPELTTVSALFLAASFVAAVVSGLAGFAFGLVAAAMWLHLLPPLQTTILVVACGFVTQALSIWKLRHALSLEQLWPFLLGGALGVPIGVEILRGTDPEIFRAGVGVFLIAFCLYRPPRRGEVKCRIVSGRRRP